MNEQDPFWGRVEVGPHCWTIKAGHRARKTNGASMLSIHGRAVLAHRHSWEIHYGPIPLGKEVYRTCKNNQCVNPSHLELRDTIHGKDVATRFFEKVEKGPGCWEWQGPKNGPKGYGLIEIDGKKVLAHRWSYEHHKGPIEHGLYVCHECDNPKCVNPSHLWLGTARDNIQDAITKGRLIPSASNLGKYQREKTHCPRGHEYTPENTGKQAKGRYCLICARQLKNARRAQKREAMRCGSSDHNSTAG